MHPIHLHQLGTICYCILLYTHIHTFINILYKYIHLPLIAASAASDSIYCWYWNFIWLFFVCFVRTFALCALLHYTLAANDITANRIAAFAASSYELCLLSQRVMMKWLLLLLLLSWLLLPLFNHLFICLSSIYSYMVYYIAWDELENLFNVLLSMEFKKFVI